MRKAATLSALLLSLAACSAESGTMLREADAPMLRDEASAASSSIIEAARAAVAPIFEEVRTAASLLTGAAESPLAIEYVPPPAEGSTLGRQLAEEKKPKRKFCNTTTYSLKGDYAYEACGSFCKQAKAQNHCKFCKCKACSFCAAATSAVPAAAASKAKPAKALRKAAKAAKGKGKGKGKAAKKLKRKLARQA